MSRAPRGFRRRTFLGASALLGSSVTGCRSTPRDTQAPAARFVGQGPERGHALRDRTLPERPPSRRIRTQVLIIGAGAAGAAAAWTLRRSGLRDIIIMEMESDIGGTARAGHMPRSAYPMGAHYLPVPPPGFEALDRLLTDLGILRGRALDGTPELDMRTVCPAPMERHRDRFRWYEGLYPLEAATDGDTVEWNRWQAHLDGLRTATRPDGGPRFCIPMPRTLDTNLAALDAVSLAAYLDERGFTSSPLRWLIDYACRDEYGMRTEEVSALAGLHRFAGRPGDDAAGEWLLTAPEGNARLVRGMLSLAGVDKEVWLNTAAIRVDANRGEVLAYRFDDDEVVAVEAETILWAAPRFILPRLLLEATDPLPAGRLDYTPWLVASLQLRRTPGGAGAPLAWDNVTTQAEHLGYVVATHGEPRDEVRPGSVVTYYEAICGAEGRALAERRRALLGWDLAACKDRVLSAMEGLHPGITEDVERVDIARWGHAMVRPRPGLFTDGTLALARAPIGRVIPCGSDVSGLPLFEHAFDTGVRAATETLHRAGRASSPW